MAFQGVVSTGDEDSEEIRIGDISLNLRLIHLPRNALEYVVIHELSHLKYRSHSKLFWQLVESVMPGDMPQVRVILRGRCYKSKSSDWDGAFSTMSADRTYSYITDIRINMREIYAMIFIKPKTRSKRKKGEDS